jgi:capsid protein
MCDKAFTWFLEAAALVGANTDGIKTSWTAPARQMIDPTKEIPAYIDGIRSGINTLPDVIRQYGKNPSEHLEEIQKNNETLDRLDLTLDSDPRRVTQQGILQQTGGETGV